MVECYDFGFFFYFFLYNGFLIGKFYCDGGFVLSWIMFVWWYVWENVFWDVFEVF